MIPAPQTRLFLAMTSSLALLMASRTPVLAAETQAQLAPAGQTKAMPKVDDAASLRLARALRAAGDPMSALPLYRDILARQPRNADLTVEFGDTLVQANLLDTAVGTYQSVPADSQALPGAERGLARIELMLNRPDRALEHANRALKIRPDDEPALVSQGVALDRLRRHAEAQTAYRQALALDPRSVVARTNLALSLALSGSFDEAIDLLSPIARSATATAQDRQNLALVYGLKGESTTALALSRLDLSEAAATDNVAFLDQVRQGK